jgi:NADP-dependent 3-hydroxy acid dehydrogenase YdfG
MEELRDILLKGYSLFITKRKNDILIAIEDEFGDSVDFSTKVEDWTDDTDMMSQIKEHLKTKLRWQ